MVFPLILLSALLNASWNAVVKGAPDKLLATVVVTTSALLMALVLLPFLPAPAAASWPYMAVSTALQLAYYCLLARAYSQADMSQVYPLMRGSAPLLVALAGLAGLGEPLSAAGWCGVLLLCGGILGMSGGGRAGLRPALLNAAVIAGYTLVDGRGVRHSGSPAAYTLWIYVLSGVPLVAWMLRTPRAALMPYLRQHGWQGVLGGLATLSSYTLVLWAMTRLPIAVVAALRETSILFALALSGLFLKEQVAPRRIGAACVIVAGAVVLRLA